MCNLIALELKRNRLRSYHIAVLICGVTMLGFQYLMAAIPYMDPTEPDAELFSCRSLLFAILLRINPVRILSNPRQNMPFRFFALAKSSFASCSDISPIKL